MALGVGEVLAPCREKLTTASLGGSSLVNQALILPISCIQQLRAAPGRDLELESRCLQPDLPGLVHL